MVLICPRMSMVVPRGSFAAALSTSLSTAEPTAPRSRPVDVGINIEYRLHIVMVDDFGRDAARDVGQVGQQLRAAVGGAGIAVRLGGLVGAAADAGVSARWPCRPSKWAWSN